MVRAAAAQLAVGTDADANLDACRRLVDAAAAQGAELIVLPALCNHPGWFEDAEHARAVALQPDGPWLAAVAERAAAHDAWVAVNVTRRDDDAILASTFLYGPDGGLAALADAHLLPLRGMTGVAVADHLAPPVPTPLGALGLYSCADGTVSDFARVLSLQGAEILCASPASPEAAGEALHVRARAAESRVFVVAAARVGSPAPGSAGRSQIVAPDGSVLVAADTDDDEVVVADLDVVQAADKARPDGTDRFAVRRPRVYAPIASPRLGHSGPAAVTELRTAVLQPATRSPLALAREVAGVVATGARLIVVPELVTVHGGVVEDLRDALADAARFVHDVVTVLDGTDATVVTTVPEHTESGLAHVGLVLDGDGVMRRQRQLHRCERHPWVEALGEGIEAVQLPWGRLAVVIGDDSIQPESFRLAALDGADVVAVPFAVQEPWEVRLGLLARAEENRLCVAAATRPSEVGTSVLLSPAGVGVLDGRDHMEGDEDSLPGQDVTRASRDPGTTHAVLRPVARPDRVAAAGPDAAVGSRDVAGPFLVATDGDRE